MHLALLLAPESEQLIRALAPNVQDPHLTVIHVKQSPPISASVQSLNDLLLPSVPLPLIGIGHKLSVFGPPRKRIQVLELISDPFWELRRQAEKILINRHLVWSKEWTFVPHISLGQISAEAMRNFRLPVQLVFDRLAWR